MPVAAGVFWVVVVVGGVVVSSEVELVGVAGSVFWVEAHHAYTPKTTINTLPASIFFICA